MSCTKLLSCRQFIREFHYSKFWFAHNDWRALVYIPWLPYKWYFQWIHIVYRWIMAVYFLSWLIVSGLAPENGGPFFLIYLTNWALIAFVLYLVVAACSVTAKFFSVHCCGRASKYNFDRTSDYQFKKAKGCCGYGSNELSWYQMIHWACYALGGEMAFVILFMYWTIIYGGWPINGVNANTHLTNGIISLVDLWFTGVPVSILHFIYMTVFAGVYVSFTGVYFAVNGTDVGGNPYIYSVIDYGANPLSASLIVVLLALLFVPAMHLLFYAMYIARFWLVYAIYGRSRITCWGEEALEEPMELEEKHNSNNDP